MLILLVVVLIAANALFVLMEFALVRVRPARIEVLARKGSRRAVAVQGVLTQLDDYLAACQVGITVLSLTRSSRVAAYLASNSSTSDFSRSMWL